MNIFEAAKAALGAPQFIGGDAYIKRPSSFNYCVRVPRSGCMMCQRVRLGSLEEASAIFTSEEITALDWVVMEKDPHLIKK